MNFVLPEEIELWNEFLNDKGFRLSFVKQSLLKTVDSTLQFTFVILEIDLWNSFYVLCYSNVNYSFNLRFHFCTLFLVYVSINRNLLLKWREFSGPTPGPSKWKRNIIKTTDHRNRLSTILFISLSKGVGEGRGQGVSRSFILLFNWHIFIHIYNEVIHGLTKVTP